jgi:two-component system phosphate regulon sensor histidine kinase PhoR
MSTLKILEKEIQTTDLSWYQMNIIPYTKKKDNEAVSKGLLVSA